LVAKDNMLLGRFMYSSCWWCTTGCHSCITAARDVDVVAKEMWNLLDIQLVAIIIREIQLVAVVTR